MKKDITLVLDISTNSTGFALFDGKNKKLITYGAIKPKVSGLHKLKYPAVAYYKIKSIATQVKDLVAEYQPDVIVIEEVNRGINRIAQKSLDACHFFVLDYLCMLSDEWLKKIVYVDSNGRTGWRPALGLKLSDEDKAYNKKIRAHNKKNKLQYAPIDWKVLAQRYVNARFKTEFNVIDRPSDADICDAIALGIAFLEKLVK